MLSIRLLQPSQILSALSLTRTGSFPPVPLPEARSRGEPHLNIFTTVEEFSSLVSCSGCCFGGWSWGLSWEPLMFLFPNCVSVVINTTAKVVSLLRTVSRSVEHGLPHVFCPQYKPLTWPPPAVGKWTQARSSEAAWTINTNRASGGCTVHSRQSGVRW